MSYHHLNFEDRTALMLESRKEGFSPRKFAELIKRHPSTIKSELIQLTPLEKFAQLVDYHKAFETVAPHV